MYIAARVIARHRLKAVRAQIREMGFDVSSTWLDVAKDYNDPNDTIERLMSEAARDLKEAGEAHVFIIDTLDESPTGGREVELGYFIRRMETDPKLKFWRVGPWRNLFHHQASQMFTDWDEALAFLRRY